MNRTKLAQLLLIHKIKKGLIKTNIDLKVNKDLQEHFFY